MQQFREIFLRFLLLGCTSFGGPVAHIGYFRTAFVEQLKWLDDKAYANLVSLSQFLPGPGSSQVGFAIGLHRAGLWGGIAAFLGFTLPSFVLMLILASSIEVSGGLFVGIVSGLKLLAVVVVAHAVIGMFSLFCKEALTIAIALVTALWLWLLPYLATQLLILVVAAIVGMLLVRPQVLDVTVSDVAEIKVSWIPLITFAALFLGLPLLALLSDWLGLLDIFFRTGSLVFGGGHVVLPLLQQMIGDDMNADRFLLGYAAAQAVPGPMFTLATFLGTDLSPGWALAGALLATLGIFLPGFLLVLGLQNAWGALAARPKVAGAVAGINAVVVGLLMAALYSPVFTSAVSNWLDMLWIVIGYILLKYLKLPVVWLVALFAGLGAAISFF